MPAAKIFVLEFAIGKMTVQAFHLLRSNVRCASLSDFHQAEQRNLQISNTQTILSQYSDVYLYQSCRFIAVVFQFAIPFQRQKVSAADIRNGAPRFLTFRGLHAKVLDTHRESGKPAMYEHKCQYCCKLRCDHVKTPTS